MRIGELSRRSGVAVPTIKYYVREGLLPPGDRTKANQVEYGEEHLRRLGLVRALLEVGGLPVRAARRVVAQLETPGMTTLSAMGKAQYALLATSDAADQMGADVGDQRGIEADDGESDVDARGEEGAPPGVDARGAEGALAGARREVDELIGRHGWVVGPNNPARGSLAEVLLALRRLGMADAVPRLDGYARAAGEIAELDVELVLDQRSLDERAERLVLWTVLGDRALSALRRLAQENVASRRLARRSPTRHGDA